MDKKLSIVVPVFNAEATLDALTDSIVTHIKKISNDYEIIFVDDFSNDNSWNKILEIGKKNKNFIGLKLANNYGVDIALLAGLEKSKGDYIFVMTCDLQDPIDQMQNMYKKITDNSGLEIVSARYANKHPESFFERFFSKLFWKIFSFFIQHHYGEDEALYRVLTRKAVNTYLQSKRKFKHIKILHYTGLKKDFVSMRQNPRRLGKSGYNIKKKLEFAVDYLTTYSYKPLLYAAASGLILSFFVLILSILFFMFSSQLVIGISFLVFSVLSLNLSIVSIYLSRSMEQTDRSNSYYISERINNN